MHGGGTALINTLNKLGVFTQDALFDSRFESTHFGKYRYRSLMPSVYKGILKCCFGDPNQNTVTILPEICSVVGLRDN